MHTLQADSHIKHYSDQIKLHNPAASTPAAQKHVIITSFVHAMLAIFLILFEYDLREVLTRWVPAALGNVVSPFFLVYFILFVELYLFTVRTFTSSLHAM